jgi:GDPmannose 4,6-dehydratase
MKTALIFGAGGQDGFYLSNILKREKINVCVTGVNKPGLIECDVGDRQVVERLIQGQRPSLIFHLAAKSSTQHEALYSNQKAIVDGTLNILESVTKHCPASKVFLAGSALQFQNDNQAIHELTPFDNKSAYAAQRNSSVSLARYFRESLGVNVYVGYFFHHDSPRRDDRHIAMKIVNAALRIKAGANKKIYIDNIFFEKEWTYAGDAMEAVFALVNQSNIFEAVIGSGKPFSIKEWGELCFGILGLTFEDFLEKTDNTSHESKRIFCFPRRINSLGWEPKIGFEEMAFLMAKKKKL